MSDRMLQQFMEMVQIDSESGNEARFLEYLRDEVAAVGGKAAFDNYGNLIATFEAAAMQQLGKIAHPVTGDVEVDLDGARDSIEMLDMVGRKTEGNLNGDEHRFLEHVLYQLRMNYVEVAREEGAPEPAGATDGTTSASSSDSADAPGATSGESDATEGGPADAGEDDAA